MECPLKLVASFLLLLSEFVQATRNNQSSTKPFWTRVVQAHSLPTTLLTSWEYANQTPVVKVTTVTINHDTDIRKAKVISDLEISDVFESFPYSHLQPLLSIQRLLLTIDDGPSQDDISEFPELANIFIPRVNSDVGLLIGNDNRRITKPHEIISSESDHYAIRTAVGWVVNCSKKGSSTTSYKSFFAKTESGYVHPMSTLCSKQNPADDPSRDLSIDEFLLRDRWKLGPDYLWKTEDKWPDQPTLL